MEPSRLSLIHISFIEFPSANTHELLVFTNKSQVYKCKVAAFEDTKSAQLGSYLAVSYTHLDVYKRQT